LIIHQFREAEAYKKKKLGELLMALAPLLVILMILTIFMLFFGETVAPTIELANQNGAIAAENGRLLNLIEDVCLDRQTLIKQQINSSIGVKIPN
jgi:hypothetical protein